MVKARRIDEKIAKGATSFTCLTLSEHIKVTIVRIKTKSMLDDLKMQLVMKNEFIFMKCCRVAI